ncbi:coiled-coil domain-containing protein 30 [Cololabis saira]|uniref:coiled-coil domain-containing protein 30 n=1 Tax=Cololabis saira TaxID=129043 RepID=UPI002AD57869|nr:coiled-coil domain-containing protein 30 [Cololabis saira]
MDQAEELEQISTWVREEGLAPDASQEAQLRLLWRSLQHTRLRLSSVTKDLETHRSEHLAEMTEVRKSLEQIRIFTEYKDILAQEIQNENDQLREQLRRHISLQDAQTSEMAKMLYHQGLTELIHSSPSEQVAYLLVERASLLETTPDPDKLTADGNSAGLLGTQAQNTRVCQSNHKRAPRHWQSSWKRLLGLQRASQSKHTLVPTETRSLDGQASSLKKECSRLERDLEEGSRRLAMAHNEIRHLTDELESAHFTQRAYEPELQSAQQEVEQLRQEVQKLKEYEMVELRKAKVLNDRLDLEIRSLRSRVRSLNAEKSSLQQAVKSLQEDVERLESTLQEQQQLSALQVQAEQADELNVHVQPGDNIRSQTENSEMTKDKELETQACRENILLEECRDCQQAIRTLLSTQNQCETLKTEICETLKCVDTLRSKYHNMKEKHKEKLGRAKQKFDDETMRRDERIKSLERELSLCSHSLAKEKEFVVCVTVENENLLNERRKLLQQLNEDEHMGRDSNLTLSLSKCRGETVVHVQPNTTRGMSTELSATQGTQDCHTRETNANTSRHCGTPVALC